LEIEWKEWCSRLPKNLFNNQADTDQRLIISTHIAEKNGHTRSWVRFRFFGGADKLITDNNYFVYSNPRYFSKMHFKKSDCGEGYKIASDRNVPQSITSAFYDTIRDKWQGEYPLHYDHHEKLWYISLAEKREPRKGDKDDN